MAIDVGFEAEVSVSGMKYFVVVFLDYSDCPTLSLTRQPHKALREAKAPPVKPSLPPYSHQ
jgi:hypothetical protein